MRASARRAVLVLLLALLCRVALQAATAAAAAFLSPAPVGAAPAAPDAPDAGGGHGALRFSADLRAGSLMAPRDVLQRAQPRCGWRRCGRSAVDLPRLLEANVALQVFSGAPRRLRPPPLTTPCRAVAAELPNAPLRGGCVGRGARESLLGLLCPAGGGEAGRGDASAVLALLSGAPRAALRRPWARCEHFLARGRGAARRSGGELQLLTSREELELFVVQRALCAPQPRGCRFAAALLAVEGVSALRAADAAQPRDEAPLVARRLAAAGARAAALRAAPGGGALSAFERALLPALQAEGVAVDCARLDEAALLEALRLSRRPLLLSAPGALPRAALAALAADGGLVALPFAGWAGLEEAAEGVAAMVAALGAGAVALASGWDGGAALPAALAQPSGRARLWAALRERGLSQEQLELVFGGSSLRLLRATLPSDDEMAAGDARGAAARRRQEVGEEGLLFDVWM